MKRLHVYLFLVGSFAVATAAMPCGDKLQQVGRGVRYQRAHAIRPATIAMVTGPAFDLSAATRLRSDLVAVGHKITIIEGSAAFEKASVADRFDIVLADIESLASVAARTGTLRSVRIVPVVRQHSATPALIAARYPHVMMLSKRALDHIALIRRVMK